MNAASLIILAVAALLTSILSGVLGGGGGMLFLAVLFSFFSHAEAIPVHAGVQLAANGTRILAFLRHVDWRVFGKFCLGMLPGGILGSLLLWWFGELGESEPYLKALVGLYILVATFLPKRPREGSPESRHTTFTSIGFVCGAAALTVGAIGPLMAPLFARQGFVKERLVATKSTCQLATHIIKFPAFLLLRDLDVGRLGLLTLVLAAVVIPGTLIGKQVLKRMSEQHFMTLYRVALIVAGCKVLLADGLWNIAR